MGSSAQRMKADNKRAGKKGSLPKGQQFVQLFNAFRQEPAWLALTYGARCAYVEIKAQYNGQNNGRIMCSVRFLQDRLGCSLSSAERFLKELQTHGFIVKTAPGFLGVDGQGSGATWRITELGCMGDRQTKDYRNYQPGKNMLALSLRIPQRRKPRTHCQEAPGCNGVRSSTYSIGCKAWSHSP